MALDFPLLLLLFMFFMGLIVWLALKHRRGVAALVLCAGFLFVGVWLWYAARSDRRVAVSQPATAIVQSFESSPVRFAGQAAEVGPTIPLDTDRPSSVAPPTPA